MGGSEVTAGARGKSVFRSVASCLDTSLCYLLQEPFLIYFHVKSSLVYSCNCKEQRKTCFLENTGLGAFTDSAHLISLFCQLIDRQERPNCSLTLKMSPRPVSRSKRYRAHSGWLTAARGAVHWVRTAGKQHGFWFGVQTAPSIIQ